LKGFVQGATAAATGAITASVIILGLRSIFDVATAAIGLVSLVVLVRFKPHEPLVVVAAGLAGLALWPLVHGPGV
jgi:chromate transporter